MDGSNLSILTSFSFNFLPLSQPHDFDLSKERLYDAEPWTTDYLGHIQERV